MHPGELRELLLLRALPGIGDLRFRELLEGYGSPRAVLGATEALGRRSAAGVRDVAILGRIERAAAFIERQDVTIVTILDDVYPAALRQLHDPPGLLFALGDLALAGGPGIAIVGSRNATPYGRDATRLLATGLARAGYAIISGLARGIDREAHEAALACEGRTIGVVGCGIDVAYPREHAQLQERIAAEGLLLSEFLPGEPPRGHNFPKRNRIIAALSEGILVIEAAATSGAMRTVDSGLEIGRDVFAVPGPIGRDTSEGTHQLIQTGAKLVTSVPDMLAELEASRRLAGVAGGRGGVGGERRRGGEGGSAGAGAGAGAGSGSGSGSGAGESEGERRSRPGRVRRERREAPVGAGIGAETSHGAVVVAIGYDTLHIDAVAAATGLTSAVALMVLLELELDGRVERLPGMRFTCR